jgi:hypothetical protein
MEGRCCTALARIVKNPSSHLAITLIRRYAATRTVNGAEEPHTIVRKSATIPRTSHNATPANNNGEMSIPNTCESTGAQTDGQKQSVHCPAQKYSRAC